MSDDLIRQYQCPPNGVDNIASATSALPACNSGQIAFDEGVYLEGLVRCPRQYQWIGSGGLSSGGSAVTSFHAAQRMLMANHNPAIFDTPSTHAVDTPSRLEVEHTSALNKLLALARPFSSAATYADIKDAVANYQRQHRDALAAGDHWRAWWIRGRCILEVVCFAAAPLFLVLGSVVAVLSKVIDFVLRLGRFIELIWKAIKWLF